MPPLLVIFDAEPEAGEPQHALPSRRGLACAQAACTQWRVVLITPAGMWGGEGGCVALPSGVQICHVATPPAGWRQRQHVPRFLRAWLAEASAVMHLGCWAEAVVARGLRDLLRHVPEAYAPPASALLSLPPWQHGGAQAWVQRWKLESALVGRAARLWLAADEQCRLFRIVYGAAPILRAAPLVVPPLAEWVGRVPREAAPVLLAFNDRGLDLNSGGGLRSLRLLEALGRETLLLALGGQARLDLLGPGVAQLVIPATAAQIRMQADMARFAPAPLADLIAAAALPRHPGFSAVLAALVPRALGALFEHCYMAPALAVLHQLAPALPVLYHAHNVEVALKAELLEGHPLAAEALACTAVLESSLLRASRGVVCCSSADAAAFGRQGVACHVVPHAALFVQAPSITPDTECDSADAMGRGSGFLVGFAASAHPPNLAAARFIAEILAPELPDCVFEIIGGVAELIEHPPSNLRLRGVMPRDAMQQAMARWDLALNPLQSGGGASVKMADYAAMGLPCLSTPFGARGGGWASTDLREADCHRELGAETGVIAGVVLAEPEGFLQALRDLMARPEWRARLAAELRAAWACPSLVAPALALPQVLANWGMPLCKPAPLPRAPLPAPRRLICVLGAAQAAWAPALAALLRQGRGAGAPLLVVLPQEGGAEAKDVAAASTASPFTPLLALATQVVRYPLDTALSGRGALALWLRDAPRAGDDVLLPPALQPLVKGAARLLPWEETLAQAGVALAWQGAQCLPGQDCSPRRLAQLAAPLVGVGVGVADAQASARHIRPGMSMIRREGAFPSPTIAAMPRFVLIAASAAQAPAGVLPPATQRACLGWLQAYAGEECAAGLDASGLDLVLAGPHFAQRLRGTPATTPLGHDDAPRASAPSSGLSLTAGPILEMPLHAVLAAGHSRCVALWLPAAQDDERALILWAWQQGVPVLAAADNPHAASLITSGRDGLLVHSPQAALGRVLLDAELVAALVRGGQQRLAFWHRRLDAWGQAPVENAAQSQASAAPAPEESTPAGLPVSRGCGEMRGRALASAAAGAENRASDLCP